MWVLRLRQVPAVAGEIGGRADPSAALTGFEKVSVIGVFGAILLPGAGVATALAADAPAGNQLTNEAREVSHTRGAAATAIVPASALRGRFSSVTGLASTWRCTCPGAP